MAISVRLPIRFSLMPGVYIQSDVKKNLAGEGEEVEAKSRS